MQMKKIVSGFAAVALALCLSMPAFAEATPGEVANSTAWDVIDATQQGDVNKATNEMKEMVASLQDNAVTVSSEMTSAGLAYFDMLEETGNPGRDYGKESGSNSDGVNYVIRSEATGMSVGGNLELSEDAAVITFTADPSQPSSTGYAITVYLPDNASATSYSVMMLGDNAQRNDSVVPVKSYMREDGSTQKYVSFWVPHFTTYQLTAVGVQPSEPEQQPQQPSGNTQNGSNNTQANNTQASSTPAAASVASAPAAAVAENPIKKTGLDMNFTAFAMAAAAAAAVCGLGYAAKKSK